MLFIRRRQPEHFEDALLERFVTEMTDHAITAYPMICGLIGPAQVCGVVRRAVERARSYGFNNQGPIRLFIEMVFVFGSEFHDDPQYAWAAHILSHCTPDTQAVCAERLYEHFIDYHEQVTDEGWFADTAFWRGMSEPRNWPDNPADEHFIARVLELMQRFHPRKYRYQGRGDLVGLIGEARSKAALLGFNHAGEHALIAMLMFALGHGCLDDPIFPDIARIVKGEPQGRAALLEDHAAGLLSALYGQARRPLS